MEIKANTENDEIVSKICARQNEYNVFKRYIDGSFEYLNDIYENSIIPLTEIFEKGLDSIDVDEKNIEKKDDLKKRFVSVCADVYSFIWDVEEFQKCLNKLIEDGMGFENRYMYIHLNGSDTNGTNLDENDYTKSLLPHMIGTIFVDIRDSSNKAKETYQRADKKIETFDNRYKKLRVKKDPRNVLKKQALDKVYDRLLTQFYSVYKFHYDEQQREKVNNFYKKIKELSE